MTPDGSSSAYTILTALNFNPWLLQLPDGEWELQFVIYQLFKLLRKQSSAAGFADFKVNLKNLKLSESLWVSVNPTLNGVSAIEKTENALPNREEYTMLSPVSYDSIANIIGRTFASVTSDWIFSKISNFDYILYLNYLAGRTWEDPNYYPIMPWVTDFQGKDQGFVDLTKTKFRQTKGDAALDSTFTLISSGATPPHHIPSLLTDLTFYLYKARRKGKDVLCKHVRKRWVPSEYPSSMKRMQEWSPEECIPDFYCDPMIFKSIHEDLPDIGYPDWCSSAEEFIQYHRSILESDNVSLNLHHWIDLTFGYKLSGPESISEKNVHLYLVDSTGKISHRSGVVQLFSFPHPPRFSAVNFEKSYFINHNPVGLMDFVEKLSEFLTAVSPNQALDELFSKYTEQILRSRWDCPNTKHLLESIAVIIVEMSLFRTASAEISAANEIPDFELSYKSRLQVVCNLYKRYRTNSDKIMVMFRPFLDEMLLENGADEDDIRLDFHRLEPQSAIDVILDQCIDFPGYFSVLYDCLFEIHSLQEKKELPFEIVKHALQFFSSPIELPYHISTSIFKLFSDIFSWKDTTMLAIFCLLPNLGTYLGRENCEKCFLKPVKVVLKSLTDSEENVKSQKQNCTKFYHREFQNRLVNLFGLQVYIEEIIPFAVRCSVFFHEDVESNTLNWVVDFVGPIHAARCLTPAIFSNLSTCYDEVSSALMPTDDSLCHECPFPNTHCIGDAKANRLGNVLCSAACLYGELFISLHYLPAIADVVNRAVACQGSLPQELESGLLGSLYVLRQIIFIIPNQTLTAHVQEKQSRLLTQTITLITSLHVTFPRAPRTRHLAFCRYLDLIYAIGLRLGRLSTEQFLEPVLRLTLIKLSVVLRNFTEDGGNVAEELKLPSEWLQLAYSVFSRIVSPIFLHSMTSNFSSISFTEMADLCTTSSRDRQVFSLGNSFGSAGSNRLQQDSAVTNMASMRRSVDSTVGEIDMSYRMWERKSRHLENQWAALWTQRLAAPRDTSLRGYHLQSFSGTSNLTKGAVLHLAVSKSNDQFAVSVSAGSSRERALAIWSLESRSDFSATSAPVSLYSEHKRRCIGLALLENQRMVLSIDSATLNLWDPAVCRPVTTLPCAAAVSNLSFSGYISSYSSPLWSCVSTMDESGRLGIASTAFGLTFIIDPRLPTTVATAFRAPPLPSGSIAMVTANDDSSFIAIGSNNSYVSVLCPRTGRLVGAHKVYDSDLSKLQFISRNNLLTANNDRVLSLYSVIDVSHSAIPNGSEAAFPETGAGLSLVGHFKSTLSDTPVAVLPTSQPPLIAVATSDRLQYYASGLDPRSGCADFVFSRLDQLRGKTVTAAANISSTNCILLGTDTGSLHMIA